MDAVFDWLASSPAELKSLGTAILLIGVAGEILTLFIPSSWKSIEKIVSASFIAIVIAGIWIEHVGDDRLAAPRSLSSEQQRELVAQLSRFAPTRFDMSVTVGDPEAMTLLLQIATTLENAGWRWVEWNHPNGPFMQVYTVPGKPNIGQGGISLGVRVEMHPDHSSEFWPAATALTAGLIADRIAVGVDNAGTDVPNHDAIHIRIGKKP
jgi:hypothetical protein